VAVTPPLPVTPPEPGTPVAPPVPVETLPPLPPPEPVCGGWLPLLPHAAANAHRKVREPMKTRRRAEQELTSLPMGSSAAEGESAVRYKGRNERSLYHLGSRSVVAFRTDNRHFAAMGQR